jgi:hypothetical protein
MEWLPATVEAVRKIVESDLENCDDEQIKYSRSTLSSHMLLRLFDMENWRAWLSSQEGRTRLFTGRM